MKDKKICGEYTIEATIQNKMRLNKCDAYTAQQRRHQSIREEKHKLQQKEDQQRERKTRGGQEEKQAHTWKSRTVNEEKDINTQRKETEVVTGREKVDQGRIRKMGTQGEIATKPKPMEEIDTQKGEGQRKMTKERNIKTENTFSVLQEEVTEALCEEEEPSQIVKIDIDENKICEGKRREIIRKAHSEKEETHYRAYDG